MLVFFILYVALLFAIAIIAVVAEEWEEEFSCNRIRSVLRHYSNCFDLADVDGYYVDIPSLLMSGPLTREAFLAAVDSTCSDEKIEEAYIKCTRDLLLVCPDLTDVIIDIVKEKISFLCENNQSSSWVRAVLNEDYMLTSECVQNNENDVLNTIDECKREARNLSDVMLKARPRDPTVPEARAQYKAFLSYYFRCTTSPYYGNDILPCGSKKKHLLLAFWIYYSTAGDPLKPPIGLEAMNQLRIMMSPAYR